MGVPIPQPCAAPGCTETSRGAASGLCFSAQEAFSKPLPDAPTLWACCLQHKRESLFSILRDLPFRTSKREHRSS